MITTTFIKGNAIVTIGDEVYTKSNVDKEQFLSLVRKQDEDGLIAFMRPSLAADIKAASIGQDLKEAGEIGILKHFGTYVTIPSISDLSVPKNLVNAILEAYKEDDQDLLNSYINFWTLASVNPDHQVRENLFWFLQHHHMYISRSGMFAAFRNVVEKQNFEYIDKELSMYVAKNYAKVKMVERHNPDNWNVWQLPSGKYHLINILASLQELNKLIEAGEIQIGNLQQLYDDITDNDGMSFTDAHTGSTDIIIGKSVSIPREDCDSNQNNTCSRGLHCAAAGYIGGGAFGGTSLLVLVNPADVVAVPPLDDYQKIRACAYWPVGILDRDEEDQIIIPDLKDGFEDDMSQEVMKQVLDSFEVNNKESDKYLFEVPDMPGLSRERLVKRLDDIRTSIAGRQTIGVISTLKDRVDVDWDDN